MKLCTACGIEKDKSEFWKNKPTKDGLSGWCISCEKSGGIPVGLERRGPEPLSRRAKIMYDIAMQYQKK